MSQDIINDQTDKNIKNYLYKEKTNNLEQLSNYNFNGDKKKNIFGNKKAILVIVFLALAVILSLFYFMRNEGEQSFDKTKVKVSINALQDNVVSGKEIAFNIKYENNTNVNLKNAKISLFIPKEFQFISSNREVKKEEAVLVWNLQNIPVGKSSNIKLLGKIIGKLGNEYSFSSKISYVPENFNYEFQSSDNLSKTKIKITSIPFKLSIKSPQSVVSGDEIEYVVNYKNTSDYDFKSMDIKINLPDGFVYDSSDIEPDEKEDKFLQWDIKDFSSGSEGQFTIKGNIKTDINAEKEIKTILSASENGKKMFEYESQVSKIMIEKVPVMIEQSVNNLKKSSATQGEELKYKIKFKNVSDKEIRGLVINDELTGKVDFNSLEVTNGSYNKESNKIIWSAFNIPKLALLKAGEEDEVTFKIKVKDYIKIKKPDDKNFLIKNNVKISNFNFNSASENIEKIIASNQNIIKLKASLFIGSKGYFNDDGRINNTGAIPPEVGKETNYLIHWSLNSLFNDLNNVKIVSVLPEWVSWTGNYIKSNGEISLGDETNGTFTPEEKIVENKPITKDNAVSLKKNDSSKNNQSNDEKESQIKEEKLFYNPKTREVVWELPKLDANTGIISPAKEIVFQIKIKPTELDVGRDLKIMNEVEAVGYDEFTGEKIDTFDSDFTTKLPDDDSIGIKEGIVISNSN